MIPDEIYRHDLGVDYQPTELSEEEMESRVQDIRSVVERHGLNTEQIILLAYGTAMVQKSDPVFKPFLLNFFKYLIDKENNESD